MSRHARHCTTGFAPQAYFQPQLKQLRNYAPLSVGKGSKPCVEEFLRQPVRGTDAGDTLASTGHIAAIIAVRAVVPKNHAIVGNATLCSKGREVRTAFVAGVNLLKIHQVN